MALLNGGAVALTHEQTAEWIGTNSAAPEAVNQGLWYFASQIAASEVKMRRALADERYASELVDIYIDQLRSTIAAWDNHGQGTDNAQG